MLSISYISIITQRTVASAGACLLLEAVIMHLIKRNPEGIFSVILCISHQQASFLGGRREVVFETGFPYKF